MLFSEKRSNRIACFLASATILLIFIPFAIGFPSIYPRDTWLHRALAAVTRSAFIVIDVFALLVWIWSLTRAEWAKVAFNYFKAHALQTFLLLTLLVGIWCLLELR